MKRIFVTLISLAVFVAFLNAGDIYIKQKVVSDPVTIMGQTQPGKDEISETWIGDKRFATHGKDSSQIVDLKKNIMYIVNHKSKNYVEMTLPFKIEDYLPEQMAQMMHSMMGAIKISVNPTGKSKKIGNWKCDGYEAIMDMMMMKMSMKIWASPDVGFDWKEVGQKLMANVMKAQMRLDDTALKEFEKIKGYWIYTETTGKMMGAEMKTTTEVLEIAEKSSDSSVYSAPPGYTKQKKFSMQDMQR